MRGKRRIGRQVIQVREPEVSPRTVVLTWAFIIAVSWLVSSLTGEEKAEVASARTGQPAEQATASVSASVTPIFATAKK